MATRLLQGRYAWQSGLVVLLAAVTLVTAAACLVYVQHRLLVDAGERLAVAAADIADTLDRVLFERYGDVHMMADAFSGKMHDAAALTQYLNRMKERYLLYRWLGVTDAHGRIVAATDPGSVGLDRSGEAWFQAVRAGRSAHVTDFSTSEETGAARTVGFSAPIFDAHGTFLGAVTTRVGLSELEDICARNIARLKEQLGGAGTIEWQFLRRDGVLIADSLLREEGKANLQQLQVPSVLLGLSGATGYVEEPHERRGAPVVTGYARTEGYADFMGHHWIILVRMDREEILAPIRALLWRLGVVGTLVVLPILGFLYWTVRRLRQEWTVSEGRATAIQTLEATMRELACEPDLDVLLTRMTEEARTLTGSQYAALGVFDETGGELARFITSGMDEALKQRIGKMPEGRGLLGHLAEQDGVLRVKDLTRHPASVGFPDGHPMMRSFLGVSVRVHGRIMGRFYLTEKQGADEFTELDEQIMSTLALAAGAAIEKNRLIIGLRSAENRSRTLLESTSEGIYGIDREGGCIFINKAGAAMLGYRPEEVLGRSMHALLHHSREDGSPYPDEACPIFKASQAGVACRVDDEVFWRRDGTVFPVEYSAAPLSEHGCVAGAVVAFTDIARRKQVEAQLNDLAHYDALTGLPNRRLFTNLLPKALARAGRSKRMVALLFLDLDRFKLINDTLGHACADLLLKAFGAKLQGCVRTTDTVSRLGGDEFTIILEDLPCSDEAVLVARRILDALMLPFTIEGREVFVASSIGIALFPSDAKDADSLMVNADAAMYAAKERRGSFQFYAPDMNNRADERLRLETGLRHALQRQEFVLHYQPQIDVRSGKIVGVEALARWQHPDRGLVPPNDFIPLAEDTGLIVPIGEWVLRTACAQVKAWQASGHPPLRLAVNLSNRQFLQPDLVEMIRRVVQETDFDPHCLELELTESLLIRNMERTIDVLQSLHGLGIRLSIDDFGTGYSSLGYLKHLPVNALKIDQSFVRHVTTSAKDASIVKAIIALARSLQMEVIAEGVETEQQGAVLQTEQCFEMQGYYFSRPVPAGDLAAWLTQREGHALVS
ncbi:MAG: EAL domain-containing protein [Nitrospirae bacterium]|nr:MAG: EAL domain-containing protein [Nitrospirota bacterium]